MNDQDKKSLKDQERISKHIREYLNKRKSHSDISRLPEGAQRAAKIIVEETEKYKHLLDE
jgi:hypothetical protein